MFFCRYDQGVKLFKKLMAPRSEYEITKYWKYTDKVYLSVVCTAFNQELYIIDAINSFLAQQTEYKFEIIIHDDASCDSTSKIVREYFYNYPNIIKLILQKENQYSKNFHLPFNNSIELACGEYVAICEGDDYWVCNKKIQKQIELFKVKKNLSLIHCDAVDYDVDKNEMVKSWVPSSIINTDSLFKSNRIRTLTTMFRLTDYLGYRSIFDDEMKKWRLGDWPLWIYLSTLGEVYLLKNTTGIYRILPESASNSNSQLKRNEFLFSTLQMRHYLCKNYFFSPDRMRSIFNVSVKYNILFGTELLSDAEKKCSLKLKLVLYLNRVIPIWKIHKIIRKLI
jgi:glycosyltransferase involved in cell wall biosynthesis